MAAYALIVGKDGPKMTKSCDASLSPKCCLPSRRAASRKAPPWRISRSMLQSTFSASQW